MSRMLRYVTFSINLAVLFVSVGLHLRVESISLGVCHIAEQACPEYAEWACPREAGGVTYECLGSLVRPEFSWVNSIDISRRSRMLRYVTLSINLVVLCVSVESISLGVCHIAEQM